VSLPDFWLPSTVSPELSIFFSIFVYEKCFISPIRPRYQRISLRCAVAREPLPVVKVVVWRGNDVISPEIHTSNDGGSPFKYGYFGIFWVYLSYVFFLGGTEEITQ